MIIRSKYLIDCTGEVVENALLSISEGLICAVEKADASSDEYVDLGDCSIIIPGLVNAHTHLELTLARDHVRPQSRFTDWLRDVIRATGSWMPHHFSDSLEQGIRQSMNAGTTLVGDIANQADTSVYLRHPLRARIFYEIIDFNPLSADLTAASLKDRLAKRPREEHVSVGISPHTPYTVSEKLLSMCAALARTEEIPLCIHLAETQAEQQFLQQGAGEILQFREEFGLPHGWKPPGKTPVQYIRDLGVLDQPATLVHCNYLSENDLDIIAASDSSVVFCPRSHSYFGHRRHPVVKMLEKNINVALGTDSLASSPSLSVLEEMKAVRSLYPDIAPIDILKMGTINGLKALAFAYSPDLLKPGGCATFTAISVAPGEMEQAQGPLDTVFAKSAQAVLAVVQGHPLFECARSAIFQ